MANFVHRCRLSTAAREALYNRCRGNDDFPICSICNCHVAHSDRWEEADSEDPAAPESVVHTSCKPSSRRAAGASAPQGQDSSRPATQLALAQSAPRRPRQQHPRAPGRHRRAARVRRAVGMVRRSGGAARGHRSLPANPAHDIERLQFAALERLIKIAKGDTGQSRRVANFLLALWNASNCGGYDFTDLSMVDDRIAEDKQTVFSLIARGHSHTDNVELERIRQSVQLLSDDGDVTTSERGWDGG